MPSSLTHNYFMKDVYNKLDNDIKNKIILKNAETFSQGPDIFYFYNMGLGRKSKKYRHQGNYMHKHNVNKYFFNIIKYIKDNKLENDNRYLSFLYGSICHFVLDSTAHPFIFYKTGLFKKKIPYTYKYSGLHQEMEYFIDAYMIFQNEKIEARDYKMYKFFLNNDILDNNMIDFINTVIKETYNYDNMGKIYNKCVRDMKKFYKYFNYDKFGIKRYIYTFCGIFTKKTIGKIKFSFYLDHNSKKYYLNLEKNEWNHPCDLYEIYNYSFIELYVMAINKAYDIINKVNKLLNNNKISEDDINLLFQNLSYTTGKDCDKNLEMKYFEF